MASTYTLFMNQRVTNFTSRRSHQVPLTQAGIRTVAEFLRYCELNTDDHRQSPRSLPGISSTALHQLRTRIGNAMDDLRLR